VTWKEKLEKKIADIEARMGREWRLYQQYSAYLVAIRSELRAELGRLDALRRRRMAEASKRAWRIFDAVAARLEWFAHIRRLAVEMPGAYSWGIVRGETSVVE